MGFVCSRVCQLQDGNLSMAISRSPCLSWSSSGRSSAASKPFNMLLVPCRPSTSEPSWTATPNMIITATDPNDGSLYSWDVHERLNSHLELLLLSVDEFFLKGFFGCFNIYLKIVKFIPKWIWKYLGKLIWNQSVWKKIRAK